MAVTARERLVDALAAHGCRGRGSSWTCPAHEDRTASLSVTSAADKVLVKCHAGCSTEDVLAQIGLRPADLFDIPRAEQPARIVRTYDYTDESGALLFQVARFEPKGFRQRRPDEGSGWTWNLSGIRRVPYRLPAVLDAVRRHERIYVVEGEKDVESAEQRGAVATCNPGGAGKWRPEFSTFFSGASVAVVADRDKAGRDHARAVAAELTPTAREVKVLEPPRGKDVSDFLAMGGTLSDLVPLSEDEPAVAQPAEAASGWRPADLAEVLTRLGEPEQPTVLRRTDGIGLVYPGRLHWWSAEPEAGKDWLARVAEREVIIAGGTVLMLDYEDTPEEFVRRHDLLATPLDDLVERAVYVRPEQPATVRAIAPLAARGFALVTVSGAQAAIALQDGDPDRAASIGSWAAVAIRPFLLVGSSVLVLDHVTKLRDTRGRWPVGSGHKLALADVALKIESVEAARFAPGRIGRSLLYVTKDRRGQLRAAAGPKDLLAEFVLEPNPDGSITAALRPPTERGAFRPTVYMERVSRALEVAGEISGNAVEERVTGKARHIRDALLLLVEEGYVEARSMPRGAVNYRSLRPFREEEDVDASG